jgi:hypothetical protein
VLVSNTKCHFDCWLENLERKQGMLLLCVGIICAWIFFIFSSAAVFFKLPKLTLVFIKLKEQSQYKDEFHLSNWSEPRIRETLFFSVLKIVFLISFIFLEPISIDANKMVHPFICHSVTYKI